MTKWIVVGVVVLAAACLTESASAQTTIVPSPEPVVVPAQTMTVVPAAPRGLFGRMRARRGMSTVYQPVYQPTSGVPVVTGSGPVTTGYYPPVIQQPVIPATTPGVPVTGIQQVQAVTPAPVAATQTAPISAMQTAPVVVQASPTYYQVRRGLFGRVRYRAVRY